MKTIIKSISSIASACLILFCGCTSLLDEQPRSSYDPTFFTTEKGIQGGLTSLYANLRNYYGTENLMRAAEMGTDEYTWGHDADNNYKGADYSVSDVTPSSSPTNSFWSTAFSNINTANAIIENASSVGLDESLIAEARFFRAFDYFFLVRFFGGVPLDLGSGELKFNIAPARKSARNTVAEVYTKCIFPDLKAAVEFIPDTPRKTGSLTKTAARMMLSKAYLTYAWWLENPNDIPTYPVCDRVDPDGHDAAWYFQQAYDIATYVIDNPGPFSLEEYYYDLFVGGNERNSEAVLYADYTQSSQYYGGGYTGFWPTNFDYTLIRSSKDGVFGEDGKWNNKVESIPRYAAQNYGRPYKCMAPPHGVFENTFKDKDHDSRYDGTFTTVYRATWHRNLSKPDIAKLEYVYNANNMKVYQGGVILTFLKEQPAEEIDYSNSVYDSEKGLGVLPGRADFVVGPEQINRFRYPTLWKIGTYRTDNGDGLGQPNLGICRPFVVLRLAECYTIAAEAAVKGAVTTSGKSARELLNVLRARAGKWYYSNADKKDYIADFSSEMVAATPAEITLDYVLEENSREFFGECHRMFDLLRTQTWEEKAGQFKMGQALKMADDQTEVKIENRKIEKYMYLRPIPQTQIDGLEMSDADKAAYQNPGYNQ